MIKNKDEYKDYLLADKKALGRKKIVLQLMIIFGVMRFYYANVSIIRIVKRVFFPAL